VSADVAVDSTESGDPENMSFAVRTTSPSSLEREIRFLPVCQPPYGFHCQSVDAVLGQLRPDKTSAGNTWRSDVRNACIH
jgi:hypothetical protein